MADSNRIIKRLVDQSRIGEVDFTSIVFGQIYCDHMFVADYLKDNWQALSIEPYDYIKMMPGSAILHYAQSVFEGLKAYRGQNGDTLVFRPDMNIRRLNRSAERLCIPEIPEDIFMSGMDELLRVDNAWVPDVPGTSLYIRPFIFATDEYIGIRPSEKYKFIIFTCPVGAYYSKPVKVKIETRFSRTVAGGTGYAKAGGNYASSLYPAKLANQDGYDQLIWTDGQTHRFIEEAGTMNLMFVIDDVLMTAETGDTVLEGITRDSVITLAKDWGIQVEVRQITVEEVISALEEGRIQEAFGVGTAATVAHIELIGHEGKDYPLPVINDELFSSRVAKELDEIKTGKIEDKFGWMHKV
jgi:branched-chain amino acid aminotransferase